MLSDNIFVHAVNAVPRASTEQQDNLGSIRFILNKGYKYVVLKTSPSSDVDGVAGDAVIYTDYSAHEVSTDATDAEATILAAGLLTQVVDMSADDGKRLWIQIKGPATMNQALVVDPTIGSDIAPSTTDLKFTKATILLQRCGTSIHLANKEILLDCTY